MLKSLRFVQGAIAKKGLSPELTHFRIEDGKVKGYNGSLSLCSPINLDLDVTPKAVPFIKAIIACRASTAMSVTATGRLSIKSGKFRAFVECIDEEFPDIKPEGKVIELTGQFIQAIKKLAPYMAEDASRPWARGILLKGQSAFVTNNIIIVQAWLEKPFPVEINIPAPAIKELIRIKEEPTRIQICKRSITFHYSDGKWLRTNLSTLEWPDVTKVLDRECNPKPLPCNFFEALEDIKPFTDDIDRAIFRDNLIATNYDDGIGALVSVNDLPDAIFNLSQLQLLNGLVERIAFDLYPTPCIFYGDKLRGAIVGMRS